MKPTENKYYPAYDMSKYIRQGSTIKTDIQQLDKTPVYIPYNVSYKKTRSSSSQVTEGSAYLKRYYSSIDAEIYFNNEYVEDISGINWIVDQPTANAYGYNSYTVDEFMIGNRLITGEFAIRFTSPNYLFQILEAARKSNRPLIESQKTITLPTHERNTWQDNVITNNTDNGDVGEYRADKFSYLWKPTFDIDVVFGQKSPAGDTVHIVIEDVKIIKANHGVSVDNIKGAPVTEVYSFVAKDIRYIK